MIRVALCDDEKVITSKVESYLLEIQMSHGIEMSIDVFFDGSTLSSHISRGSEYDLIYLDIEMEKMNGVDAARWIREIDKLVLLIYISSHEIYLKELFEVEPFRFLGKPINKEEFEHVFLKAYEKISSNNQYFEFKYNREIRKIPIKDIQFFESDKRVIYIYTNDEMEKFYGKLNDVEKKLKSSKVTFLRIHRSYLVNYNYVKKIGVNSIEMLDGTVHEISIEQQKKLRQKYCMLIGGDISD